MKEQVELSIVTPMYNEAENVRSTVDTIKSTLSGLKDNWELILVNDGSTDKTLQIAQSIEREMPRLCVVSYPKNKGRGYALRRGFAQARGRFIVTIDFDLSYDASYILSIYKALRESDMVDIIVGSPYIRGGNVIGVSRPRILLSKAGNKLLKFTLPKPINTSTGILRGYRRKVINSLELSCDDKSIHLEILSKALALGFTVNEIPATLRRRKKGKSKFAFSQIMSSHLSFVFLEKPILLFGFTGLLLLLMGLAGGLYISYIRFIGALNPGRPLINLVVISVLAGVQLLCFGFISIQIGVLRKEIYRIQRQNKERAKDE